MIIEGDGLCKMIGEAAVTVGVVIEAVVGATTIGDDATSANFGGNVLVLTVTPLLSINYNNKKQIMFI